MSCGVSPITMTRSSGVGRHVVGLGAAARDRHERVAIGRIVAEGAPLEIVEDLEVRQLDRGGVAIVARQQREVGDPETPTAPRAARARPASSPCGRCRAAGSPRRAAARRRHGTARAARVCRAGRRPAGPATPGTSRCGRRSACPQTRRSMPKVSRNARVIARRPARPLSSSVPSMSNRISAGRIELRTLRLLTLNSLTEQFLHQAERLQIRPSRRGARAARRRAPWQTRRRRSARAAPRPRARATLARSARKGRHGFPRQRRRRMLGDQHLGAERQRARQVDAHLDVAGRPPGRQVEVRRVEPDFAPRARPLRAARRGSIGSTSRVNDIATFCSTVNMSIRMPRVGDHPDPIERLQPRVAVGDRSACCVRTATRRRCRAASRRSQVDEGFGGDGVQAVDGDDVARSRR